MAEFSTLEPKGDTNARATLVASYGPVPLHHQFGIGLFFKALTMHHEIGKNLRSSPRPTIKARGRKALNASTEPMMTTGKRPGAKK